MTHLRGLDLGRHYRVTCDNSVDCVELDGFTRTRTGVPVRLEHTLTSELLLVEAIEERS